MSDTGRQNLTDKASDALKPDSEKSTLESLGDSVKSTGDSLASTLQPESQKSTTQQAADAVSTNSNQNTDSLLTQAQNAMGFGDSGNSR
ncbi:MAG: heat shock protein 9/12-domain-containing protein [Lentinula lateritia]|uniref:Heat shock protein 9/12-domain-containing protein n=1 Tax=Lentinula lateritia TaxID=40482 RepID=A0ABQ8VNJ4_9AGAR|nr:MAG: heat shock protein 9/12-domain-containing protein [Lentinula lateritia]KAJ4497947.1 heat shock protein 9/12-domain-containing protein [Lentinula lateritia]